MVTIRKRAVYVKPIIGGSLLTDWVSCHLSFQLDQPVAKATIVAPVAHGNYDDAVTVAFGTDPGSCSGGTAPPIRFSGRRRKVSPSLDPRLVQHECIGQLGYAQEYFNADDPIGAGGLWVQDLVPGGLGTAGTAYPADIVKAVLDKATVACSASDIGGTAHYYGLPQTTFVWHAGTHSVVMEGESSILLPTESGESALDYILRYDQIDAEATLDGSGNPISGGFYRTFESLAGRVYRKLIGGRPRNSRDVTVFPVNGTTDARSAGEGFLQVTGGVWPDPPFYIRIRETDEILHVTNTSGFGPWTVQRAQNQTAAAVISSGNHADWIAVHEFTENINIVSANLGRDYPEADYVLVKGGNKIPDICQRAGVDPGVNLGPWYYRQTGTNPYMLARIVYDKNPPSSDMIQWDTTANAATAGFGIDCQTIAQARILFVNRIIVGGTLVTAEEWLLGPGQTVLVQGQWSQTGYATGTYSHVLYPVGNLGIGQPDRLLTGEPLWVQGVDYEMSHGQNGEPVIQTTLSLLGGGAPDTTGNIPAPPIQ